MNKQQDWELQVKSDFPKIRALMQKCYSNGFKAGSDNGNDDGGDYSEEYSEVEKLIQKTIDKEREKTGEKLKPYFKLRCGNCQEIINRNIPEDIKSLYRL